MSMCNCDRFHKGDVLVTVATGEMSDADADRAGLVPTHAYAMLDIREVQVTNCETRNSVSTVLTAVLLILLLDHPCSIEFSLIFCLC